MSVQTVKAPESSSRKLPESNKWAQKPDYKYSSGVYRKGERK